MSVARYKMKELIDQAQQQLTAAREAAVRADAARAAGNPTDEAAATAARDAAFAEASRLKALADQEHREASLSTDLSGLASHHAAGEPERVADVGARSGVREGQDGAPQRSNLLVSRDDRWTPQALQAFDAMLRSSASRPMRDVDARAIQPMTDPEGGYAVVPEIRNEIIRQERERLVLRQRARVIATNAASVAFPTFKINPVWAKRNPGGAYTATTTYRDVIGKVSFTPKHDGGIILIPEELIEDQSFPVDRMIAEEIVNESSEKDEQMFLRGSGKDEGLGILSTSILTATNGGTTYTPLPQNVQAMPFELRAAFRRNGIFVAHRRVLAVLMGLRDGSGGAGTGQFIWQMGLQAGQPNMLAGYPVEESEAMTNSAGLDATNGSAVTGDPVLLFGDLSQFWIVERLNVTIQVLRERYADTGMVGFKYRKRLDCAPVRLEAFVRMNRL